MHQILKRIRFGFPEDNSTLTEFNKYSDISLSSFYSFGVSGFLSQNKKIPNTVLTSEGLTF